MCSWLLITESMLTHMGHFRTVPNGVTEIERAFMEEGPPAIGGSSLIAGM